MEHGKQVEILKALMQQLDEGKNIDAGVQYRHQTKAYVCTDRAAKEEKEFFKNQLRKKWSKVMSSLVAKHNFLIILFLRKGLL